MAPQSPNSPSSPRSPRKRSRSSSPSSSPWSYDDYIDGYASGGGGGGGGEGKRRRNDLSVVVCKDFLRRTCRRAPVDCKFAHPHSAVAIEGDKVTACADSLRNKCFRGSTCRYYHPPPHIQKDKVTACADSLRNKCFRGLTCRYYHPPPHIQKSLQESIGIEDAKMETVCQDFLHGRCERKSCRYSHVPAHSMPQAYLLPRGAPMNVPNSPPRIANDQDVLPVCKDFLKNMCRRESCKYAHPDSQTEVIGDQVEVCRDFRRGLCHRPVCRFYHPSTALSAAKVNRVETHPLF
ncbi:Zinc finger CCCH domain-containing protein 28 [Ananas comosus]|uniref:Zinc finger CCCH domain-containing protein 28 n=1 Tax=Ananas comosus TaxID=4615 RepID=A0A199VQR3_ANACO|nr:Zinc finger CCCH domain-containing protein 28 [Ananas comosus]